MNADLEREFSRAIRFGTEASKVANDDFGLPRPIQWGLSRIEWWGDERRYYEPYRDGSTLAIIAPIVEGGELVDLAAIDPFTQHLAQRIGLGHALGIDALEKARMRCCDLYVCERPLDWLRAPLASGTATRQPIEAIYLFDLTKIAVVLDGVERFAVANVDFGHRVSSLLPLSRRKALRVRPAP